MAKSWVYNAHGPLAFQCRRQPPLVPCLLLLMSTGVRIRHGTLVVVVSVGHQRTVATWEATKKNRPNTIVPSRVTADGLLFTARPELADVSDRISYIVLGRHCIPYYYERFFRYSAAHNSTL